MLHRKPGGVTIPGEAGYEALTLRVAEKWGADVIRDSDGTALSERLLDSDYKIYSTVCVIRGHNAWLKEHPHCLQQTFLGFLYLLICKAVCSDHAGIRHAAVPGE